MSNPTTRGKYKLLQLGEGLNSWGLSSGLNGGVFERLDEAVHGVQEITLTSTSYTLTTTNYVENDIRYRILSFSGNFAATISIPASTENWWIIKNSTGQILTFSNGSNSATIGVGFYGLVHTNGTAVESLTLPDGVSAKTVADNISSVNQVATDSASVIAVAGKSTEVGRLGTTAAVADLAALGGTTEVASLNALSPRAADIGTLAPRAPDLQALAPREADLNTLSPRASDLQTLAPRASDLQALAPREADLNTLSPRASDLQTLSPRAADIGTLADVEDGTTATNALSTLAPISAAITGVNTISSAVTGVNNISSAVSGVNSIASAVTAVNTDPLKSNINTTAGAVTNVNNVGTNIANVNSVASNMASVNSFGNTYQISTNNPTTGGDGSSALANGMLAYVTSAQKLRAYNATAGAWEDAGSAVNGTSARFSYTATANQTTFPSSGSISYDANFADVYLNGIKLLNGTDVNVTSGTNVVLASGAAVGDIIDIVAFGSFNVSNTYTQAETNTLLAAKATTTDLATTNATVATKAPLASPNFTGTPQIGGSNILTSATAPASGGTADFVAQGNLTNGMTVGLRADGKVEPIVGVSEGDGNSTASSIAISSSANRIVSSCYDETNDKTIIFYADGSDNKAVVCTVSSNTLTFGTPVTVTSGNGGSLNTVCHDPTKDRLVFAYTSTNSNNNCARVGQLSGTGLNSITVGAETTFASVATTAGPMTSVFQKRRAGPADVNYVIITWHKNANNYLTAAAVEINAGANTCTVYSAVDIRSANTANHDTAYFDDDQRIVASYVEPSNTYNLQVRSYSLNSNLNSFTIGSGTEIDTATWSETQVMADPLGGDDRGFLFARESQNTGYTHCWAIRCFGGSISKGTGVVVNNGDNAYRLGAASNGKNKAVLFYTLLAGGTGVKSVVVSRASGGDTITAGTPATFQSYDGQQNVTHYDPDAETFISISRNNADGIITAKTFAEDGSNNTSFIGISDAVTSSGNTGAVKVFSGIKTGLSSLTPNSIYYVQADGTISTTSTSPAVKIGRALSTTSLQLTEANT